MRSMSTKEVPGTFHPNGALSRRQLCRCGCGWAHPDIDSPGTLYARCQFLDQLFRVSSPRALDRVFELHRGLEHFQRCGSVRPPLLARPWPKYPCHSRAHVRIIPLVLLQQLGGLAGPAAGGLMANVHQRSPSSNRGELSSRVC